MPSLKVFGRHWNIASDDFVFPELTEAFIRAAWIVVAGILFSMHQPFSCRPSWDLTVCLLTLLGLNAITLLLCLALAFASSRGTILEEKARGSVNILLYIRAPFFLLELATMIISTVFIIEERKNCTLLNGARITILIGWILCVGLLIGILLVFQPGTAQRNVHMEQRAWRRRLRLVSLRRDDLTRTAVEDVAQLIASFSSNTDLVLSDIAAGLLLLVGETNTHDPPADPMVPGRQSVSPPDWMTVKEAERYINFAIGVYGWPTYVFNNCGCCSWWRFCWRLRCRSCCGNCKLEEVMVVGDTCCGCHSTALALSHDNNGEVELYIANFENSVYRVPFSVTIDHSSRAVVIAIRGSASILDLVTDLCLADDVFSSETNAGKDNATGGEEVRVHRGMMRSADAVLNILEEHDVLIKLRSRHPDYALIVCGHSLGGGVATLLTLRLQETYPDVRCFAYSPPGCVLNEAGLRLTDSLVCSVMLGDDVVPRMSYQSMHQLMAELTRALTDSQQSKHEILIRGCFRLLLSTRQAITGSSNTQAIIDHSRLIDDESICPDPMDARDDRIQLYPPGQLMMLKYDHKKVLTSWISPRDIAKVKLTPAMLSDHLPYALKKALRVAVEELPDV